ncbi:hypothetical protein AAFF_G00274430 [Aldrovandia affinis]|uniref:Uncharacterized protein n=1 Tax=Aldrovandia affinis TaxID=143900 RepID=A0AAD7STN2_9TELE|nr:hypothetical protein AAFF_G00274430 [Aldrovandia affinis]
MRAPDLWITRVNRGGPPNLGRLKSAAAHSSVCADTDAEPHKLCTIQGIIPPQATSLSPGPCENPPCQPRGHGGDQRSRAGRAERGGGGSTPGSGFEEGSRGGSVSERSNPRGIFP